MSTKSQSSAAVQDFNVTMPVKRLNRILSMLLSYMKELDDDGRDFPIRWNIMHMYTSSQLAKIIALKRGLDPELAGIAAALHDIGVVVSKKHAGHAEAGELSAYEFLRLYNNKWRKNLPEITQEEIDTIIEAVVSHDDKEHDSGNPIVELLKDVDSLDRYLHGIATKNNYLKRCEALLTEFGL